MKVRQRDSTRDVFRRKLVDDTIGNANRDYADGGQKASKAALREH